MLVPLLVIVLLISANALYVAAEFAAVSVRRSRIRQLADSGDRQARALLPVIDDAQRLDRYVAACQIGITLSSLILGAYGQATLSRSFAQALEGVGVMSRVAAESAAAAVVLVGLTALQVVFGELVPKSVALQFSTQTALFTVHPMRWSLALYRWFIAVLNGSGLLILRLLGITAQGHRHIHSPEEIDLMLVESQNGGGLDLDEQQRLRRALRLGTRPVHQLMVPRLYVTAIDVNTPIDEALRLLSTSPYTRLPVFEGSIDNVVGMVHTKDVALRLVELLDQAKQTGPSQSDALASRLPPLREVMRPVLAVPESLTADRLLAQFRERHSQQAIVVDEFGGVAGFITLEDVLAEVMGDVGDEFKSDQPEPERLPDGRVRLPGLMRPDEAEPWVGVLWQGDADTVGGLVTASLGHLPDPGERVTLAGVEVEVERVANHAVGTVLVTPRAVAAESRTGADGQV